MARYPLPPLAIVVWVQTTSNLRPSLWDDVVLAPGQRALNIAMNDEAIHLSVVIPAFEEVARLGGSLGEVRCYLESCPFSSEVLVVVDGGTDGTLGMVRDLAGAWPSLVVLDNEVNRGKGYSVQRGMLTARGRYRLFSDADLSTPISEADRLMAAIDAGGDMAIGSRTMPDSDVRVRQVWWRESMGRMFNQIVRRMAVSDVLDTQCGFKCFRHDVAERIFARQRMTRFSFDVELLWIARKLGYRVVEVPVTWVNDPISRVHPVSDSLRMLVDLVRLRLYDWRGAYQDEDSAIS